MTEKIEWYKEVLELEPNSKVFFPLARLLSEAGRTDEAVEILEQGLARHEDFLEARLFLPMQAFGRHGPHASMLLAMRLILPPCCGFWPSIFQTVRYHCTKSSTRGWPPCLELEPLLALGPICRRAPRPPSLLLDHPHMRRHLQRQQRLQIRQ